MDCQQTVLVIGSGGREHALAWKLSQSAKVGKVLVYRGNAGTSKHDKIAKVSKCFPGLEDYQLVADWCLKEKISLVVVGPEDPLSKGFADAMANNGIMCFGPSADASLIEASKEYAKRIMDKYNIPTAQWKSFSTSSEALTYIESECTFDKLVVKADGLAAGKGVIIADTKQQASDAVKTIMEEKKFGSTCGDVVIIEEYLQGFEVSCMGFSDGRAVCCMPLAQDHKRLLDGGNGPNTGGMGAYAPCTQVTQEQQSRIYDIMQRTVTALASESTPFIGVLYGGFMITEQGPQILEFNCRFGDPETQVLLPLLESDLYEIMVSCVQGNLADHQPVFSKDTHTVAVVLVSGGYPDKYAKGLPITGLSDVSEEVIIFHAGTTTRDSLTVTSGGRVLAVVSSASTLEFARDVAYRNSAKVQFDRVFYRRDIAASDSVSSSSKLNGLTYADSGVSISAGDELISQIKPLSAATSRCGCVGELGLFGSVFDMKQTGYKDPLLISGTDGVGTKLLVANACKSHESIGQDLVAMCVNDILCHGAEPLYFLDYFASGKLEVEIATQVVKGVASACKMAGCALVGGETAEMPGMYPPGKYDLAGFAVGAVERESYLPRTGDIIVGDVIIGLPSSGVHSNGYSLIRRLVDQCGLNYSDPCPFKAGKTLGEELLIPTCIYVQQLLPVLKTDFGIKAMCHITGGGLLENIARVLPSNLSVSLDASQWTIPSVFGWIRDMGNISFGEMAKTFNCGIGMILIVKSSEVKSLCERMNGLMIGQVKNRLPGNKQVYISHLNEQLKKCWTSDKLDIKPKVKVGVLISGSGTNLQALIDSCQMKKSSAEIVMVISNKPGVKGLERAKKANIASQVICHKQYKSREEFDDVITSALEQANIELVCLAGFMRILSGKFVKHWKSRLINIHPSLLPSFKGIDAHKQVLAAGVKVTGCTVHFVVEEVDSGAILQQEAVPVLLGDTRETLEERVKLAEHVAYPRALQAIASQFLLLRE